jgi:GNAT superfamily N-acetyltransferase
MVETKTFSKQENYCLAIAELSYIPCNSILEESIPNIKAGEKWFYFNRLNVPVKIRNKGIAKELLQQVIEWADGERYNIWLDINPYGDLDLRQLISLYMKYGFKMLITPNTMIRRYNVF